MPYDSISEVGNSQVSRQKKVLHATRKLVQKDQTQTKNEEKPSSTKKLAASSPEFRNMEYTNHRYMSKILWWYSNKSRIDEMHTHSIQLEGAHLPQRKFVTRVRQAERIVRTSNDPGVADPSSSSGSGQHKDQEHPDPIPERDTEVRTGSQEAPETRKRSAEN